MQQMINLSPESRRLVLDKLEKKEFSTWLNEVIPDILGDVESIKNKITHHKNCLVDLNSKLKIAEEIELKKLAKVKDVEVISDFQKDFWLKTIKILEEKPGLIEGRKSMYNNEFGKDVNTGEFRSLYLKMKKELK